MKLEIINPKGRMDLSKKTVIKITVEELLKSEYKDVLLSYNLLKRKIGAKGELTKEAYESLMKFADSNKSVLKACFIVCHVIKGTDDVFIGIDILDIFTDPNITNFPVPFLYWNAATKEINHRQI